MGSRRRAALSDFLFPGELPVQAPEGFVPSQPRAGKRPSAFAQDSQGGLLPEGPGWRTSLLLAAGLAAAGGGAFFLLGPGAAAAASTEATATATAEAAAGPTQATSEELLQRLGELRAELQGLVGDAPQDRTRRAAVQEQLRNVEQQLEALHSEMLAGRTLRQLTAADAARRSSGEANSFLRMAYDKIAPAFAQLETVRRVLDQRMTSVSTKVPQLISEEVESATEEIKSLFQSALPVARMNIADQLPQMTMLLAGLLAPLQLRVMWADNLVRLALSGAILSMDVISLITAHGTRCISQQLPLLGSTDALHIWIGVDAVSLAITVAVGAMIVQKAGATIAEVDAASEVTLATDASGDPEEAFRANMEKQLLAGAQAIIMYDSLAMSTLNRLPPMLALFDFAWQANGLFLLFDTPGASCGAHFLLDWARGRGIIFLIGLVPTLLAVGLAAVRVAVQSPAFSQAVLETAASVDETSFSAGPPVCTIFVRSFVVRDATDVAGVKLQVARAEEAKLLRAREKVQAEKDSVDARLASTQAELEATTAQIQQQVEALAQSAPEAEFLNQYRQAVAQAIALSQSSPAEALGLGDLPGLSEVAGQQLQSLQDAMPSAAAVTASLAEAMPATTPGAVAQAAEEDDGDADMGGTGGLFGPSARASEP